jgi:hypothetical protein
VPGGRGGAYTDLSPSTISRDMVLGPSTRVKPVPAPHSVGSVPGAHATEYVVVAAFCSYH